MIIEINNSNGKHNTELCMCEFQGEIEGELPGNELGKITITEDGKALMDIGLHLLEGNVVKLKLPFLAVEKKKNKRNISEISNNISTESSLEILGVIRKKIIFKTRPKPTCNVLR